MKSQELCIYIERLRSARNMSQEELISDVISIRQYRRYLNGESDIPFPVVDVLCDKLGIQTITLIKEMEVARVEETKKIDIFYNTIVSSPIENDKIPFHVNEHEIIDSENRLLYKHSVLLFEYNQNRLSKESFIEKNKEILGYPKFKKKTIFTLIEILILSKLLEVFDHQKESNEIYEKLLNQLNNETTFLNDQFSQTMNIALFRLAKVSGMKQRYEDVLNFCNLGIKNNITSKMYHLMDYFYYFSSLACYHLEKFDEFKHALIKCYHILKFENNVAKFDMFSRWINKDFEIQFETFVLNHYNQKNQNQMDSEIK